MARLRLLHQAVWLCLVFARMPIAQHSDSLLLLDSSAFLLLEETFDEGFSYVATSQGFSMSSYLHEFVVVLDEIAGLLLRIKEEPAPKSSVDYLTRSVSTTAKYLFSRG